MKPAFKGGIALIAAPLAIVFAVTGCATTATQNSEGSPPIPLPDPPGHCASATGSSSYDAANNCFNTVKGSTVTVAVAGDIACEEGTTVVKGSPDDPDPDDSPTDATTAAKEYNNGNGITDHCWQKWTSEQAFDGIKAGKVQAVLPLGDLSYGPLNSDATNAYHSTWGRDAIRNWTYPAVGNHDGDDFQSYWNGIASGKDNPNGAKYPKEGQAKTVGQAGIANENWYSFDTGDAANQGWHVVVLNSNCQAGDSSCVSSHYEDVSFDDQIAWLKKDLAATQKPCVMAAWHHPMYYAEHLPAADGKMKVEKHGPVAAWKMLNDFGADVVVNGHHHYYARLAPLDGDGVKTDPGKGIVEFQAGMGGKNFYTIGDAATNPYTAKTPGGDPAANNDTFGVLQMHLGANSYGWDFSPAKYGGPAPAATNGKFTDSGTGMMCRTKNPAAVNN